MGGGCEDGFARAWRALRWVFSFILRSQSEEAGRTAWADARVKRACGGGERGAERLMRIIVVGVSE